MKKIALATFATLAFSVSAHASDPHAECYVADPTGTPLKYRSAPYGKVLGTLKNGTRLFIMSKYNYQKDKNGKPWAYVEKPDDPFHTNSKHFEGWVYLKYLNCTVYHYYH
ncbi:SH3 domain-containing protein [Moraxella nasicaprae]|uniref:SH3 domain-containing protein n=1 Tax=Moraxella nasicaprae TaxID=2904122 RepID=A0ABY6F2U8_9GAMM|nr:SH3 domain-containing protein [Moraxella nasicaprae]UXZ04354.1 SH3 domain-containing protein [Moraxella nasicaprae]